MQITVATGSLRHCRVMVAFAESSSDLLNVRLLNVRLLKVRLLKVRLLKVRLLKVRAHGPACDRDYLSILSATYVKLLRTYTCINMCLADVRFP
jgi:hypothetical protein